MYVNSISEVTAYFRKKKVSYMALVFTYDIGCKFGDVIRGVLCRFPFRSKRGSSGNRIFELSNESLIKN